MDKVISNIRTTEITPSKPVPVGDTMQLSGLAKNSLSGKNDTTQYSTSGSSKGEGPYGGLAAYK